MCTEENFAKTKALETAPIHEMKFLTCTFNELF